MRRTAYAIKTAAAALAAVILICAVFILSAKTALGGGESYCFYVGNTSKNCRVVTADKSSAALTRLVLRDVCGESATYPADFDWRAYLENLNGEELFCEELGDSTNYYCRCDLPYFVNLYGQEVNLHVCVRGDCVILGTPIIFGGY